MKYLYILFTLSPFMITNYLNAQSQFLGEGEKSISFGLDYEGLQNSGKRFGIAFLLSNDKSDFKIVGDYSTGFNLNFTDLLSYYRLGGGMEYNYLFLKNNSGLNIGSSIGYNFTLFKPEFFPDATPFFSKRTSHRGVLKLNADYVFKNEHFVITPNAGLAYSVDLDSPGQGDWELNLGTTFSFPKSKGGFFHVNPYFRLPYTNIGREMRYGISISTQIFGKNKP